MTVGIIGGGQLGRMLALAGHPLGLRFRVLEPAENAPAACAAEQVIGRYDDPVALDRFADGLDLITYEFENVPVEAARRLAERMPVYPPPISLEISQDRLAEKTAFQEVGTPVPAFAPVGSRAELAEAVERLGLPAVLKTRRLGYDGKGQYVLRRQEDLDLAWAELGAPALIMEAFVPFERELSILSVRGRNGETGFYPLVENHHAEGILRLSLAPAPGWTPALQHEAEEIAGRMLARLDYVGVLAIELFQLGGRLLVNEMAPRVHNSGHWTIEGAETSQFENHLRAVLGLPLGSTAMRGHAAMVNLIGALPDPAAVLEVPGAHLHLYDKAPRPGRKVGHITLRTDDLTDLERHLPALRALA